MLLLGVALDVPGGWPDNCTDTARLFGVTREAVRDWRGRLVAAGLVTLEGGRIVPTGRARALLRCSDPLPRRLLRGRGPRPSPEALRACASLTADTIGPRADRRGVRTDRERADAVGVSEKTVRAARRLLASLGLLAATVEQRGRARVVRVVAERDARGKPRSAHGSPPAEARLQAAAERAERGRARLRRGANEMPSEGANEKALPMQGPSVPSPMQPAEPAQADGDTIASRSGGCPEGQQAESAGVAVPVADPTRRHRSAPATVGDVLAAMVPDLPAAKADRAESAASSSVRAAAELRRLAADPQAVPRLLRMPAPRAVAQVLAAAQVYDKAPRRRDVFAVQVARVLDPVRVLMLALDVVLGRPRNVGVVLLGRLKRTIAGEGELLTRCRASWPIGQFLEAVAHGSDAPARPVATPRTAAPSHNTTAPATAPRREPVVNELRPMGGASFDDLLRGMGLGELARRATA